MQRRNIFEHFQELLKATDGEFRILEHQVPVEIQMEYFNYSNRLRDGLQSVNEDDFELHASELFNPETSLEDKRRILSSLAVSRQAKTYRILEKYLQSPDKELTDWAHMALMESRVALESEFSDERQIYISTGLGGKENKFRFYILLPSSCGHSFLDYQRQVIEREFTYAFLKEDCEIEQLTIRDKYAELLVLAPIQSDAGKILENVVNECNQYGDFLSTTITITNVKKLDASEIAQIIKKHEDTRTGI